MYTYLLSFTFAGGDRVQDLILDTKNGQRRFNITIHEDRIVVDVRRRYAAGDWEPFTEFVLNLSQYHNLVSWLVDWEFQLESHG
jgi:hypothetical protein